MRIVSLASVQLADKWSKKSERKKCIMENRMVQTGKVEWRIKKSRTIS